MSKFFLVLIFLLVYSFGYSQIEIVLGPFNDRLDKYSHFNKIDSIIEYNFLAHLVKGKIIKGDEDRGRAKTTIIFNDRETVVEISDYISSTKKGNTYQYKLDNQERIIERLVFNNEREIVKIIINYQNESLIEKLVYFYGESSPRTKWSYEFDMNNMSITENIVHPNNEVYSTYEIDKNGRELKREDNDYYRLSQYSNEGKLIEEEQYARIQIDDGRPISPIYKTIYNYDNYLNIIEIQEIRGIATTYKKYQYVFDENNNWIERIEFSNDKPILITEREIVYRK